MYQLGGGRVVAPAPHRQTIRLRLNANMSLGYSCGDFDPAVTIRNGLNNLKRGADDAADAVVNAATGAVASLPMYMLQRANPDWLGILRDWMNEYEAKFKTNLQSCEQREAAILSGKGSPYGDLVALSQQAGFNQAAEEAGGSSNADIVDASEASSKKGGCIDYIGNTKAGCESEPSVKTTQDVTVSGYAITVNVTPTLRNMATIESAAEGSHILSVLGKPDEAKEFAVAVLGEAEFAALDKGQAPVTTPGRGLHPQIRDEVDDISEAVNIIFDYDGDGTMPTDADFEKVQAPSINLRSPEFVSKVRSFSIDERRYFAERIKYEVATAKILDKALLLKRVLLSGAKEPSIYGVAPIQSEVKRMVDELDNEIKSIVFERNVREQFLSGSVIKIIEDANRRATSGSPTASASN